MQKILNSLLDFILPPICPVTAERVAASGLLSSAAWEALQFIEKPWCPQCGAPQNFAAGAEEMLCAACLSDPPPFDTVRSIWRYNDGSSQLVMRFKHGDQLQLVRSFTPMLRRGLLDIPAQPSLCIPVPLHRFRLFKRLYNQSAVLATALCRDNSVLTYLPDALIRTKATKSQGHMDAGERHKNVRNAFQVAENKRNLIKGKNILLIDDVYTSGATVKACAQTLKEAGAARVDVLTLTRVVKDS